MYHIQKGAVAKPLKACVYGPEGVGKTTFASEWPGAVFIDIEDGSGHYDVARMPRPGVWADLIDEVNAMARMAEVGTVVIDTADAAEALCVAHVLDAHHADSIEKVMGGYGKGYTALAEEFRKLLEALDFCVRQGKHALVVAHAQIRKFEQPDELGAYDRWELKLQKKTAPLVKEWADLLLFANFKNDVMKGEDGKVRTTGGKRRLMHASHDAAYDAKNRLGLPDEMPFEFSAIAHVVNARQAPEAPAMTQADERKGALLAKLDGLMGTSAVTPGQLQRAVASRESNPYTADTPVADYPAEFIEGVLLAHWDAIVATVRELEPEGTVTVTDVTQDGLPF